MRIGDAEMSGALTEMLVGRTGVATYECRSSRRTVLHRRPPVTGWWYGFRSTQEPTASRDR